jgi:hypothetical protein
MDRKPRSNSASHFVLILPVFSSQAAFRSRSAKDRNKGFRSMTQSPHQHRAASVKRTSLVRLAVRTLICLAAGRPDGSSRRPEDIIVIASASATTEHALSVRPDALDASHREPAPRNPRIGSHSQAKASGKDSGAGRYLHAAANLDVWGPTKGQANNESRLEVPPSQQLLGRILLASLHSLRTRAGPTSWKHG